MGDWNNSLWIYISFFRGDNILLIFIIKITFSANYDKDLLQYSRNIYSSVKTNIMNPLIKTAMNHHSNRDVTPQSVPQACSVHWHIVLYETALYILKSSHDWQIVINDYVDHNHHEHWLICIHLKNCFVQTVWVNLFVCVPFREVMILFCNHLQVPVKNVK